MLANLYGDIHAGTLTERVGNPHDTEPWQWRWGSIPADALGISSKRHLGEVYVTAEHSADKSKAQIPDKSKAAERTAASCQSIAKARRGDCAPAED